MYIPFKRLEVNQEWVEMKRRTEPQTTPDTEDEIDRILRGKHGFRRLSREEVARLSQEEIERLEDEYDVARAQKVLKAIEEGRMELVSGEDLKKELDRICAEADEEESLT